jgi:hypothetical protein
MKRFAVKPLRKEEAKREKHAALILHVVRQTSNVAEIQVNVTTMRSRNAVRCPGWTLSVGKTMNVALTLVAQIRFGAVPLMKIDA